MFVGQGGSLLQLKDDMNDATKFDLVWVECMCSCCSGFKTIKYSVQ